MPSHQTPNKSKVTSSFFPFFVGISVIMAATYIVYTWFSYALTAPNLVLTQWAPFWEFQQYMWKTFFNNRQLLTWTYAGILTTIWAVYAAWIWAANKVGLSWKHVAVVGAMVTFPLLISNNNLSYDVFNYIFNAKMVMEYQADPHVKVALEFPDDPWIRFMHNTHTPAPYGYGWTVLSLVPYLAGMGKFLVTWLSFRLWSFLSLVLLGLLYYSQRRHVSPLAAAAVLLNPLTLTEIIANSHNDLWMMVPALASLALLKPFSTQTTSSKPSWKILLLSATLLLASTTIKFASLTLVPLWFFLAMRQALPQQVRILASKITPYWPALATGLMFIPLLTSRSQQFHPWYFMWCLAWLPFVISMFKTTFIKKIITAALVAFAISSSYRYLPYLWHGEFLPGVLTTQKYITWVGGICITLILTVLQKKGHND